MKAYRFGRLLKDTRDANGFMTQAELKRLSGVPVTLISALENGRRTAGKKISTNLANALRLQGKSRTEFMDLAKSTTIRFKKAEKIEQVKTTLEEVMMRLGIALETTNAKVFIHNLTSSKNRVQWLLDNL